MHVEHVGTLTGEVLVDVQRNGDVADHAVFGEVLGKEKRLRCVRRAEHDARLFQHIKIVTDGDEGVRAQAFLDQFRHALPQIGTAAMGLQQRIDAVDFLQATGEAIVLGNALENRAGGFGVNLLRGFSRRRREPSRPLPMRIRCSTLVDSSEA